MGARRVVVATVVVAQLGFVARGYWSDHKEFAFQMFPESSTWRADIVRVTTSGERLPVDGGWAGSITMYLTNTLAIRTLTVEGDSVRMVVASREGDVVFRARLTDDARAMEGIVEYHGGARLPMTATRRARPVAPR